MKQKCKTKQAMSFQALLTKAQEQEAKREIMLFSRVQTKSKSKTLNNEHKNIEDKNRN